MSAYRIFKPPCRQEKGEGASSSSSPLAVYFLSSGESGQGGFNAHERRRVKQPVLPAVNHRPTLVHLDQVAAPHLRKGAPERVHPEGVRADGVADGDVAGDALVEAVLAEDAEGEGEAALEVVALGVLVGEGGGFGEGHEGGLGFGFGESGLEGGVGCAWGAVGEGGGGGAGGGILVG